MKLKHLIEMLKLLPGDKVVKGGFGHPMSYRGSYDCLAFCPMPEAKISDMLKHAKSAMGAAFLGYKGGSYIMEGDTICYICEYGETTDAPMHPLQIKEWERLEGASDDTAGNKMPEIDTYRQALITCPHCGHKNKNTWECGLGDGDEREEECGSCEMTFVVTAFVERTFSTEKLKGNK